jgi:peptidoglycan DL-endopeptidase CwlO
VYRLRVALTAVAVLVFGTAVPAHASPTIAELERQIAAASNKLEPLIEDYNRVHSQLVTNRKQADALQKKLTPLALTAALALASLQPMAIKLYEGGPLSTSRLMLGADSTASLLNQIGFVDQIAKNKKKQINLVLKQRDTYAAAKKRLDVLRASLQLQDNALAAKTKTIEAQVAALQKLRQQVYGTTGAIGRLRPVACPFTYSTGKGGIAARKACTAIGKPYVWSAAGPNSFDCSGLTLWAWAAAGVTLRHYTVWQYNDNTPVSKANLRPGDLVFFYPGSLHHMAIYVGGGWIVHAPQTGDYVRMARLDAFPWAGARRPS